MPEPEQQTRRHLTKSIHLNLSYDSTGLQWEIVYGNPDSKSSLEKFLSILQIIKEDFHY